MIDKATLQACKDSSIVLEMKIKNLEFAVSQSELIISESRVDHEALKYDLGVFIISPTDKGGHLHTPSDKLFISSKVLASSLLSSLKSLVLKLIFLMPCRGPLPELLSETAIQL